MSQKTVRFWIGDTKPSKVSRGDGRNENLHTENNIYLVLFKKAYHYYRLNKPKDMIEINPGRHKNQFVTI